MYLGRSGWVQVQQRSLDENRRINYAKPTGSLELSRRTGIKLANYHCNSEPGKRTNNTQRPAYLPLLPREHEPNNKSPSPPLNVQESPPPSITPIISPPPAFQDRKTSNPTKARSFFGKAPFLPRSNAIVDSDIISPPPSPPLEKTFSKNSTLPQVSQSRRVKLTPSPVSRPMLPHARVPQTKSLEDTTNNRRTQFLLRHGESSSSSSSSMGFRSLDSCMNRPTMPKLSENTDSSIDVYEDADEEDNNSSSLNVSVNTPTRDKISPSGRARLTYYRSQTRRSPAGSDTPKQANCSSRSSSTSSNDGFTSKSPSGTLQIRRSATNRTHYPGKTQPVDDSLSQKVRRSRSLQLPDKKVPLGYREPSSQTRISPQHPESHRVVVKIANTPERPKRHAKIQSLETNNLEEEMLREAEIVTEFLYGTRSRAAAQALLIHRYNNSREEKPKDVKPSTNNGYDVFYVTNTKERQKVLQRGVSIPNAPPPPAKPTFRSSPTTENANPCTSTTCDFWPHCAHRESLNSRAQSMMRLSQSYPTHQRSLDSNNVENNRSTLSVMERTNQEHKKRTSVHLQRRRNEPVADYKIRERKLSPNKGNELSVERKISPVSSKNANSPSGLGNSSNSSSSSDIWLTTSDRTISKSPKNAKSSGASTPLEEAPVKDEHLREVILTRPGSAPMEDNPGSIEAQQRSMSLPKSFLSVSYQQG